MSSNSPPPRGLSPDDVLPPVEPPNAGFILQLFFIPGVIVAVIVMIWLLFNWLAQKGNDREAFVAALKRNNEARWQAAFNLANALHAEQNSKTPELTVDPILSRELAGILGTEIEGGSMDKNSITLRIYLCRALGEFKVDDGLPMLIRAANTERNDDEGDVRRAALEGIALLAANAADATKAFAGNEQLRDTLFKAAEDTDPRTRSAAAVAIGVIGGEKYIEKLRVMEQDSNPDVRYNAAMRLAHLGDAASVPILLEMLDQKQEASVQLEKHEEMRPFKRELITVNALRAVNQLAAKNATADLGELSAAVERLIEATSGGTRIEATNTLRQLKGRKPAAA